MAKLSFSERFLRLNGQPISFAGRPYLPAIYAADDGNLVLRASRQVEKSTFLATTIIYEACRNPHAQILFVSPREDQASVFVHDRLWPLIHESPVIRRMLLGKTGRVPVKNCRFANGARFAVRAAFHSADACRGLSANLLLIDEYQDIAAGVLPVLQETLSHARHGRIFLTGTPKMVDNHLEAVFNKSTANEWTMTCQACAKDAILDERSLGPLGIECPACHGPLDPKLGRWVARNPHAIWGQGFWISHPMVPWLNYDDIRVRRDSYDPVLFLNEVLGLPTSLGSHVVTRAELEACCTERPLAKPPKGVPSDGRERLVAGIDWGGGVHSRTVLVIGYMRQDFVFEVLYVEAFLPREDPVRVIEEVAKRCQQARVMCIAADGGGNGHLYNRLLSEKVHPRFGFYAILYGLTDSDPITEGVLTKWTVGRSSSIGVLFGRVKKQSIQFPRQTDVGQFLDEFACETAEYNGATRTIQYTHPDAQLDDALHATNYALLIGTRAFHGSRMW